MCNEIVGVNGDEGTPVPIPNTVVKLVYGDNTWLATAREDNSTPTPADRRSARYSSIAQLVEHAAVNRRVVGSSPTWGAKEKPIRFCVSAFLSLFIDSNQRQAAPNLAKTDLEETVRWTVL